MRRLDALEAGMICLSEFLLVFPADQYIPNQMRQGVTYVRPDVLYLRTRIHCVDFPTLHL